MTIQQDREQLFLELVNRDRLDPSAAATRYGLADLNYYNASGTLVKAITADAKQPLAFDAQLLTSATRHTTDMIGHDLFSHTGSDGSTSGSRMVAAGLGTFNAATGFYSFGSGENISWSGTTGVLDANAAVYQQHQSLFLSGGHRANALNPLYEELGVSAITDTNYQGYNALVNTENFAYQTTTPVFVTGVNYTDTDNNDFYSIGESAAGRTVQLYGGTTLLATTTTAAAGGYGLQTAAGTATASGAREIVFSGGGLTTEKGASFVVGALNVKIDLTDGNTIESNVSTTLTRTTGNLTLIGMGNVDGAGNALANTIAGNRGNNLLTGNAGNDILKGGAGIDILNGGLGSDSINGGTEADTVVFSGNFATYAFNYNASTATYTVYGADGSIDTVTAVESFQFADATKTLSQLPITTGVPVRTVTTTALTPSQNEGNTGTTVYSFEIRLNGAVFSSQSVSYTVAGNGTVAANATDFSGALTGSVVFAPGETVKTVTVLVNGDTTIEQNETFALTITTPTTGLVIGTPGATATIISDDASGPNIINGTAVAETLAGTAAIDQINGLAGNDTLTGGASADVLNGGDGIDTTSYATSIIGVTVNLLSGTGLNGDAQGDSLVNIENAVGSGNADILTGNGLANNLSGGNGLDTLNGDLGNDLLTGGAGADALNGGTGNDSVMYMSSVLGVTVNLGLGTGIGGDAEGDRLTGIENVYGSNAGDALTGDAFSNLLVGYSGIDSLNGGLGNDTLMGGAGADALNGGNGIDTVSYNGDTIAVDVSLLRGTGLGGNAQGDTLTSIENIYGSNAGDVMTGNTSANTLSGLGGNDILEGGVGNDLLVGGTGNDTFLFNTAGFGADTINDFASGIDRLRIINTSADQFSDLVITGNGSTTVTATVGLDSIILTSASGITLAATDFLFV